MVDINKSDRKLLKSVFQAVVHSASKAEQYTDAIMDMRARTLEDGPASSGVDTQNDAGNTFPDPFVFVDVWELTQVRQIPTDVLGRVAPYLTVYSRDGTIDPRAAPSLILASIPGISPGDLTKVRYANPSALNDLIQASEGLLTDQTGPAYIVKVQCHRPHDDYRITRTFAVLVGIDQSKPYRLLTKWPMETTPEKASR